jgi:peroxiredoxin
MSLLRKLFGGQTMAALNVGTKAPEFTLKAIDGKEFSWSGELVQGPIVLAFFKVSCPTCQYTFPFLERLHKAYGVAGGTPAQPVRLVGVSQNNVRDTAAFMKQFGVTFPVLLDELDSYPVSNAYGLTNVPTLFWIAGDGKIEVSSVGWLKKDFEEINQKMAEHGKTPLTTVFQRGEDVRDFRAG